MINKNREIKIEKIVLSIGGIGESLDKGVKLLEILGKKKVARMKSKKRIPSLNVRPGLEVGAVTTLRKNLDEVLKIMLATIENKLNQKQINENSFSFGIKEYIEVPGMEYQREIGIIGFDICIVFKRAGRRIKLRKIKRGKIPKKQNISKEEIIKFMEENFQTKFE